MSDPGDDDVIRPGIRRVVGLARKDRDRRPAGRLGAAMCGRHHLVETAGDDDAAPLREQPADLLRRGLVLAAAADDGDLVRHRTIVG